MDVPYKLYNKDCLEVIPTISDVEAVVTDPPYGEVNRVSAGLRNLDRGSADIKTFDEIHLAKEFSRIAKSVYVWCGTEQVSSYRAGFVSSNMSTRVCVWEKTNPSPMNGQFIWLSSIELCVFAKSSKAKFNEFCASPVWRLPTEPKEYHPTAKPVLLMKKLILASTNEGDTVFDPFMGSGTTGIAALQLGRRFIGCEIDPKYFAIAEKRIKQAAQQPALLHEAQQSVHLTAFGAGGRGQNSLQSSFIADDSSAKHGGK